MGRRCAGRSARPAQSSPCPPSEARRSARHRPRTRAGENASPDRHPLRFPGYPRQSAAYLDSLKNWSGCTELVQGAVSSVIYSARGDRGGDRTTCDAGSGPASRCGPGDAGGGGDTGAAASGRHRRAVSTDPLDRAGRDGRGLRGRAREHRRAPGAEADVGALAARSRSSWSGFARRPASRARSRASTSCAWSTPTWRRRSTALRSW